MAVQWKAYFMIASHCFSTSKNSFLISQRHSRITTTTTTRLPGCSDGISRLGGSGADGCRPGVWVGKVDWNQRAAVEQDEERLLHFLVRDGPVGAADKGCSVSCAAGLQHGPQSPSLTACLDFFSLHLGILHERMEKGARRGRGTRVGRGKEQSARAE